MGLSETILAAMIGALATVSTALFQLYNSFKQTRRSADTRPRKGSTLRSVLAVLALMVASGAGGFLYSEFIKQRAAEDMRAMRSELQEMRAMLATGREAVKAQAEQVAQAPQPEPKTAMTMPAAMESVSDSVESVVYVPACRADSPTAACGEQDAQRIALCGTIPAYARVDQIRLFAQPDAMQHPWDQHQVTFEQDLGGARFTGKSFEYAQGAEQKAVCVNFMQWSSEHPHIARIVVQFGFGTAPTIPTAPAEEQPAAQPLPMQPTQVPAVIAAESLHPLPAAAVFTGPPTAQ
ncbi:MAG: hypothetical protein ABW171_00690 [Steroidobacter sp.]